jgi:hypothetical protein
MPSLSNISAVWLMVAQSDLDPMITPTSGPVGVLIGETSRKEKTKIIPIIHAHSKYIRTL